MCLREEEKQPVGDSYLQLVLSEGNNKPVVKGGFLLHRKNVESKYRVGSIQNQ